MRQELVPVFEKTVRYCEPYLQHDTVTPSNQLVGQFERGTISVT